MIILYNSLCLKILQKTIKVLSKSANQSYLWYVPSVTNFCYRRCCYGASTTNNCDFNWINLNSIKEHIESSNMLTLIIMEEAIQNFQ